MKTKKLYLAVALGLSLALSGCSSDSSEPKTETHPQETVKTAHTGETAAAKDNQALTGTVAETFNSGGYTYILLDTGHDKIWTAIGETRVEVGQKITLANGPVMKDFHSTSLNRTFPEIVFSSGIKGKNSDGHSMMGKGANKTDAGTKSDEASFMEALGTDSPTGEMLDPAQATGGSSKAIVSAVDITVTKATGENAYTVGEIYTKAKELNGKPIRIQAKVVKVSPHIMGKNWLHLQDGSGNPMHNTHDLVVTTNDTPELDSIITVEGVVAAQKDFGAGYFYEVIVEEAVVKK
jgi:hypothetical protein